MDFVKVGAIVQFRAAGHVYNGSDIAPAMVTRVWRGAEGRIKHVSLKVFGDGQAVHDVSDVSFSETEPRSWFWPS